IQRHLIDLEHVPLERDVPACEPERFLRTLLHLMTPLVSREWGPIRRAPEVTLPAREGHLGRLRLEPPHQLHRTAPFVASSWVNLHPVPEYCQVLYGSVATHRG